MMSRIAVCLLASSLAAVVRAQTPRFKVMHVADLAAALESSTPPTVCDANTASVREHAGVIPGARLLSSYSKYDVARELPADKKSALVFYCANTLCTASHVAARKALDAGYADVSVMVDGIFGWKKAGQPRAPIPGQVESLAPKAVAALERDHGAVIVDVREGEERFEVVPGARWMPLSKADDAKSWSAFAAALPKNQTIAFYCASGVRAKIAAKKLAAQGYATAYFESADQWKAAGLPVAKGPAQ
ncbi:MAG: hypothetical protein HKL90_11605 [Elusimicrobia bacterium]|nr:hypothetical protein [Elusimicrobiota bacterium]